MKYQNVYECNQCGTRHTVGKDKKPPRQCRHCPAGKGWKWVAKLALDDEVGPTDFPILGINCEVVEGSLAKSV